MSDADIQKNLNCNMDARAWAQEFMRIFGRRLNEIDDSLMIGWFANSIMCGFDEAKRRDDAIIHKLKSLLLLTDPAVSDQEMNSLSAKQFAEFQRWENQPLPPRSINHPETPDSSSTDHED